MTAYTLTSTKATDTIDGDLAAAFTAAIAHEASLQPAGGVSITDEDGDEYVCRDGSIEIECTIGDEEPEAGRVYMRDGALMIAWEQGCDTPFSPFGVIPA